MLQSSVTCEYVLMAVKHSKGSHSELTTSKIASA